MKNNEKFNLNLLKILACPLTKAKLEYDANSNELICKKSQLAFPIKDSIPIMLINKARKINATKN